MYNTCVLNVGYITSMDAHSEPQLGLWACLEL